MADILIVVDSTAKAEFMRGYFGGRPACVICSWPLFQTSHQPHPAAPAGLHLQFSPLANGQEECIAALDAHGDKEILLVLDANARANYLCWQISGYLGQIGARPEKIKRISPAAFTAEAFEAALCSPAPVDDRQGLDYFSRLLFDECLARHLIRLIGSDRGPANLPLRQPSLSTLFLLADRERERLMFQPVVKWQVQAELRANEGPGFTAHLAKGLDLPTDGLIRDVAKARIIQDQVSYLPFVVDAIHRAPLTIAPPEPFQLAELAHEAWVRLDLTPTATMTSVRHLFHGVMREGKRTGLISSYSPESLGPSDQMVSALQREVARLYPQSALLDAPLLGPGAIIPLHPELNGAELADSLTQAEGAIYDLIRTRALASQMRPAVGETLTVDLRAGKKSVFQALFHELFEPGFLQATPEAMARFQAPCPLEEIQEGQEFRPSQVRCQEVKGESQIAERYTIETLFAALADFSIPADPVTMVMVDALIRAEYITVSPQGALFATDNTAKVVTLLARAFPRMQGVNLSAYIEQTVAEVVSGRKGLPFALKQFDQTLMLHGKSLVKAKITSKLQPRPRTSTTIIKQGPSSPEPRPAEETESAPVAPPPAAARLPEQAWEGGDSMVEPEAEEVSPLPLEAESAVRALGREEAQDQEAVLNETERPLATAGVEADRLGAGGEGEQAAPWSTDLKQLFAAALSRPASATEPAPPAPSPQEPQEIAAATTPPATPQQAPHPCPVCGRALLLKEDPFGAFWGCSGFPGCRYSEAMTPTDLALACPLCGQGLCRKQTPTGKSFYVCTSSDCQFISWSRPHYLPCGLCDSPYLVEKTVRGVGRLRCPRAGCPYEQPVPGGAQQGPTASGSGPKKVLVRRVAPGAGAGSGPSKKVRVVRKRSS